MLLKISNKISDFIISASANSENLSQDYLGKKNTKNKLKFIYWNHKSFVTLYKSRYPET